MTDIKEIIAALPQIEINTKNILLTYDVSKTPQENIESLVNENTRPNLELCVTYIKSLKDDYPAIHQKIAARASRVKQGYAGDISIFINGITQIDCENCDEKYCHTSAVNTNENDIKCYCCNRFAHKTCYTDVIKPGLHFICSVCTKKEVKEPAIEANPVTEAIINVEAEVAEEPKDDSKEDQEEKSNTICPRLVVNECPHGISGAGCEYKHPKWCFKYSQYGDRAPEGCRRGRKCWFYHPKLCENSLALQICLNKKCKDVHIKGTRRFQPKSSPQWENPPVHQTRGPLNLQSQHEFPNLDKPSHNTNEIITPSPWFSKPQKETNNNEQLMNAFLEKCLDRINTQVASAISQKVDEAVQRSLLLPIKEKVIMPVARPAGTEAVNNSTPNTSQQEDLSSILKCLKQLIPNQM